MPYRTPSFSLGHVRPTEIVAEREVDDALVVALGIQLLDRATNVVAAHGEDTRGALKRIGAGRR